MRIFDDHSIFDTFLTCSLATIWREDTVASLRHWQAAHPFARKGIFSSSLIAFRKRGLFDQIHLGLDISLFCISCCFVARRLPEQNKLQAKTLSEGPTNDKRSRRSNRAERLLGPEPVEPGSEPSQSYKSLGLAIVSRKIFFKIQPILFPT